MKSLWKYIVGFFSFIGGIIALVLLGSKKNKRVKEIKRNIKDNEKATKAIDKEIAGVKETDEYIKKTLVSKKKALKEIEDAKKAKPKKKSTKKAKSRLKNIGKGKK